LTVGGGETRVAAMTDFQLQPWWGRVLVGRHPRRTLVRAATLIALSFVLFKFVFVAIRVTGQSMEPTYRNGRVALINRLAYRTRAPQRGEVVSLRLRDSRLLLLKRIVALPGEAVELDDGRVLVDGELLRESYVRGVGLTPMSHGVRLQLDEYFAMGDNREISAFGVVRRDEIQGKVLF